MAPINQSSAAPHIGRFVHVGKTLTDLQFWAANCTKMRLAAGLGPDPLGNYSAPQAR